MTVSSHSIQLLPEPKLEFGYRQSLEDPRNGLFLFGPIVDNRTPAQIRAGVIGTPRGVSMYKKWVEATGKFIPAASANVQHQFPFPGFEAAFRARWTVDPVAEIAISPTEISNTIRLSDRHKAIFHTVSLYERPIRDRLRDDDIAEWSGFSSAVPQNTNLVGVRIVRSQDMKLFRPGTMPVLRGTTYRLSSKKALLWTSGFIHQLSTYAGREVPNPLLVEICRGSAELDLVLTDVMGLTKVNFNACLFADGLPVTLRFADAVGEILTAAPVAEGPPLPFRHYI